MTLLSGTRLGPYEIVAPIGAGGMGEVYRGTDTRLDRVVALKILPSHLSSNPELRERFDREARAISAITHPHICTLYDVGHHEGADYLVMEFVEGESVEERLKKGPLTMEQVLRYGSEIADALGKAHRHGIVHRDLKPSNIMITKSGAKLLDFGLAKIVTQQQPVLQLSYLPTAQRQLTQEGAILGTFQYMAPEQLEGIEADARTDIFALGTVLYEMATGKRAFEGKSRTSLIAAIVDRDPTPISSIQPMTPPAFERVVKTCLAKDPDDRWQSARDIANELRWIQKGEATVPTSAKRRGWIPWAISAAAIIGAAAFAGLWERASNRRPNVLTSSIIAPEHINIDFDNGPMVLSPEGSRLAFIGVDAAGNRSIWIRPLHSLAAQPLAGTDDATEPFWSPDGRFIAFFAAGKLKKIDISGGPAQAICDATTTQPRGGTWGPDGTIVFAREAADGLYQVSSSGGTVTRLTSMQNGELSHRWPFFLPGGKHLIFMVGRGYLIGFSSIAGNSIDVLTIATGARRRLVDTQSSAQYASGQLLFSRDQALVAQPFDIRSLRLSGEPAPIAEGVAVTSTGDTVFSANQRGQLVYESGAGLGLSSLHWFDRSGKLLGDVASNADYRFPAISHDGRRVAVEIMTPNGMGDIWVIDLARSTSTRLTFGPASNFYPLWSPDDRYVYFTSSRNDPGDVYRKLATGVGPDEEVVRMPGFTLMTDISSDGRYIAFQNLDAHTSRGWDMWMYSTAEKKAFPFLATRFTEASAKFSPDGRWVAYRSDESARRTEVYVQTFPASGGKWQISTNGGTGAAWSPKGDEIFYTTADNKLMVVPVKTTGTFEAGMPKLVLDLHSKNVPDTKFYIAPDGQRILVNVATRDEVKSPMTFVENWTEMLRK